MAYLRNDRVGYDYEVIEKLEAGMVLLGTEVKSLRMGQGSLRGARVAIRGGAPYLIGATIPPWQKANADKNYDSERPRKLLLNTQEMAKILGAEGTKGLTTVPISVYNRGRKIKLEIAIARGKKTHDKRETLKKRDFERRVKRNEF